MRHPAAVFAALLLAINLATGCSGGSAPVDVARDKAAMQDLEASSGGEVGGLADSKMRANEAPAASRAAAPGAPPPAADEAAPMEQAEEAKKEADGGAANQPKPKSAEKKSPTAGMYIIRRASLTIQVGTGLLKKQAREVARIAEKAGGFVSESAIETADGQVPSARLTLRVPAAHFDQLLDALGGVGTVFSRNIDSEDVTVNYVDTASKIRNKKLEEAQLLKLLQRTGKLLDVLEVERELSRVRGEIEEAQGRLRHLGSLVDLATIEISMSEKVAEVAPGSPWGSLFPGLENAWNNAFASLANSLQNWGAWLIVFVIASLPFLLAGFGLYVLVGWLLLTFLVRPKKVMPEGWFTRFWVGLGLAAWATWYPPVGVAIVLAALAAAVLGAGAAIIGKFFVRKRELD